MLTAGLGLGLGLGSGLGLGLHIGDGRVQVFPLQLPLVHERRNSLYLRFKSGSVPVPVPVSGPVQGQCKGRARAWVPGWLTPWAAQGQGWHPWIAQRQGEGEAGSGSWPSFGCRLRHVYPELVTCTLS